MKKYKPLSNKTQGLSLSQRKVYQLILKFSSKKKRGIQRKDIQQLVFYALSTVSDVLQELRKRGLAIYVPKLKKWLITAYNHKLVDIYDAYINFIYDVPTFGRFRWRMRE